MYVLRGNVYESSLNPILEIIWESISVCFSIITGATKFFTSPSDKLACR